MENKDMELSPKKEVYGGGERTEEGPVFIPSVDIFEDEEKLILVADMPGVNRENVEIRVKDGELFVKGSVKNENPGDYVLSEYTTGDFIRTFTISDVIDHENISASMKNGVLKLHLPKTRTPRSRKISIS